MVYILRITLAPSDLKIIPLPSPVERSNKLKIFSEIYHLDLQNVGKIQYIAKKFNIS